MPEPTLFEHLPNAPKPNHFWPQQSPINLSIHESYYSPELPELSFSYCGEATGHYETITSTKQNGESEHHLNFILSTESSSRHFIKFGSIKAYLKKIHIHTKSEHDVEGQNRPGETHLIHEINWAESNPAQPNGSTLIVLGAHFCPSENDADTENLSGGFFENWADNLQSIKAQLSSSDDLQLKNQQDVELPLSELISNDVWGHWYWYQGSLTSGSYHEIVTWFVFRDVIPVRQATIDTLKRYQICQPERPVEPISRRFVLRNFAKPN